MKWGSRDLAVVGPMECMDGRHTGPGRRLRFGVHSARARLTQKQGRSGSWRWIEVARRGSVAAVCAYFVCNVSYIRHIVRGPRSGNDGTGVARWRGAPAHASDQRERRSAAAHGGTARRALEGLPICSWLIVDSMNLLTSQRCAVNTEPLVHGIDLSWQRRPALVERITADCDGSLRTTWILHVWRWHKVGDVDLERVALVKSHF